MFGSVSGVLVSSLPQILDCKTADFDRRKVRGLDPSHESVLVISAHVRSKAVEAVVVITVNGRIDFFVKLRIAGNRSDDFLFLFV